MKVTNQVHSTNDYSLFSRLDGNREINTAHKNRLKKSIKENNLAIPIIVNEKHEIIDGQHRFLCWKELNLPINHVIVKGYGLKEVRITNAITRNWKISDFTDSFCDLGYKDYIKYREFKGLYNLGDYESMSMLSGKTNGSSSNFEEFRTGLFKATQWSKACSEAKKILEFKEFYQGYKRRSFVFAMLHLINHPNYDQKQMLSKLKYQSSRLVDCVNKEQYIFLLQDIYNFKQSQKVNLMYN
tara:strand:- start:1903 stop:2625 length:723 start_codon:yes stop_codon:yes gene_type:complete